MSGIAELLRRSRVIAVVGLSSKKFRASYGVAEYMQREGYRIIPVNPNETEVLGEKAYARLEDVPQKIDIVNIFRRPIFVRRVVESAILVGAKAIWMQEGGVDEASAANDALGFLAAQHWEQIAPRRGERFARQQISKNDAPAQQQLFGEKVGASIRLDVLRGRANQRPTARGMSRTGVPSPPFAAPALGVNQRS